MSEKSDISFFAVFAKKAWFSVRLTVLLLFGTGFQPAVFAISYPETSSPVTKSIGFQPKLWGWTVSDNDSDNDSVNTHSSLILPL